MSADPAEALDVLRNVWRSQGQTVADLVDPSGEQKSCKRMAEAGVGYEDFAGRRGGPQRRLASQARA